MNKVQYLEGLRGAAALIVVLAHYVQFYYSEALFKNPESSIEIFLSKTPINLIYNGNFAVCIFFVLSGYVLSMKFFQLKDSEIIYSSAVRRYFRLAIPVLFSVLLAYILLLSNSYELFAKYTGDLRYESMTHNIFAMLKITFYDIFFNYSNAYNGVLWTMTYELFGSFLIFSFLMLFGKTKKRFYIYILLITIFWNSYYLAFVLGLVLSDWHNSRDLFVLKSKSKYVLSFIFLFVGLFIGSYPYGKTTSTIYHFLNFDFLDVDFFIFYHIIGAFFIVYSLLNFKSLQFLLSTKLFVFLGKVSFPLYLIHLPILASFSFFLFDFFIASYSYRTSFILSFIISMILTFVLAHFSSKYIDNYAVTISKYIYRRFFK